MFTNNARAVIKGLEKCKDLPEKMLRKAIIIDVKFLHKAVTDRTPVHTGRSLANWVWSVGSPFSGTIQESTAGDIGQTRNAPLGSEGRRAANQSKVDQTLASLDFSDPFQVFYLTNNAENIMDLEMGKLPTSKDSRSPDGMARISLQELKTVMSRMQ